MSDAMAIIPKYRCHKEVWALQITEIGPGPVLHFAGGLFAPRYVSDDWISSRKPVVGGYFVQYEDGYESFSPRVAFEEGYTRI